MSTALKNTIYYTIGNIVKALTSFLLLPVFANLLGAEQYGVLNILQTYSAILVVFMTLSIDRSIFRLYYDYSTDNYTFISTTFWTIMLVSIIALSVNFILGSYITQYVVDIDLYKVLLPTILYTMLYALISYTQVILQVEQRGHDFLIISLILLAIYNIVSLLFLYLYSRTVESLVFGNLVANVIVLPFAISKIQKRIKFKFSWDILKNTLHYSLPLFVAVTFAWILNFTDRLFIASMASYSDAGIYSLASKFVQLAILFIGAISQAYTPFFYNIANTKSKDEAITILKPVCNAISSIISMLFLTVVILTNPVLHWLFNDEYSDSIYYVYLLAISGIFSQQTVMLNLMIYQNKKIISLTILGISCGIVSVLLNVFFIPIYGSIAAGFSNLIVGILIFFITHIIAKRSYYIPYGIKFSLYSLILFLNCFLIDIFIVNIYSGLFLKILSICLLLYLAMIFNIININDHLYVFKKTIKSYIKKVRFK